MTENYQDFDVHAFQRQVIAEFRDSKGQLSGMFEGWSLAVLTTVGARTGQRRESILGYLEIDGKAVVIASAMGSPKNPDWYHNIRHNPIVTVETGADTYTAIAALPSGEERDKLFEKVVEQEPGYGEYQAKTTRVIPVVVLHRTDRVNGMGDWLKGVHDWLRDELAELGRRAGELVNGSATTIARTPPDLGHEMRTHCLNFCTALKRHHTGEDVATFPMLARQFPALAPALAELGQQHEVVSRLQNEIQRLVDGYVPGEGDPVLLRDRLAALAAELERHFDYEERTIVTALNALAEAPSFE
ncbi:nitroreductase/quinone reductase family protein [Amycolatopsis minnesotensis]|uniref:Nitroreductase/quinone reductase family protein n=1 Tax=Amycolatopsis minnesotensis TaxID=337894 RepID=A0ABN2RE54_9PSEU